MSLLFTCDVMMGLVIVAETCCHLVTLNKINIHNTSCVFTCESLLLTCSHRTKTNMSPGKKRNGVAVQMS
jgi:hypothetical protein